jgi:hypothetical protein
MALSVHERARRTRSLTRNVSSPRHTHPSVSLCKMRRRRRLLPAKLRQRPGLRQAAPVTLLTYSWSKRVMSWTSFRNEIVSTKVPLLL